MDNTTDFFYNENGITSEGEAVAQPQADEELTDQDDSVVEAETTDKNCLDLNEVELKITDFEDRLLKLEAELILLTNSKNEKTKEKKKDKSKNKKKKKDKSK